MAVSPLFLLGLLLATAPEDLENLMDLSLEDLLKVEITTVSKTKTSITRAPGIVSVITQEEIRNLGAQDLGQVLNLVVGFEINRAIMFGAHQTAGVRGRNTDFGEDVLIMMDGQRLNEVYTGSGMHQIKSFNTANIRRIELIRGPGSPMYGSNAFVGIINIITRDYTNTENSQAEVSGGSDGHLGINAGLRFGRGNLRGMFHLFHSSDDGQEYEPQTGFLRVPGTIPAASDPIQENLDLGLRLGYRDFDLRADWFSRKNDGFMPWGFWDRSWPSTILDTNKDDSQQLRIQAKYSWDLNEKLSITPSVRYLKGEIDQLYFLAPPGLMPFSPGTSLETLGWFGSPKHQTDNVEAELQLNYQGGAHSITSGLFFGRERLVESVNLFNFFPFPTDSSQVDFGDQVVEWTGPDAYADPTDRKVKALYVQDTWYPTEKLGITGGLRFDEYSDFGNSLSPRLALVYNPGENLTWKFLYGNAFRAPTFNELYVRNNPVQRGNAELEAQTIDTLEANISLLVAGKALVSGSVFYNRYQNLIQLVPVAPLPTYFNSSQDEEDLGLELEVKFKTDANKYAFFGYSYIDPQDADGNQRFFVARHRINATLNYSTRGRYIANLSAFYHGNREVPTADGRGSMKDALNLNLNLRWVEIVKNLSANLMISNLTDEDWQSPGFSPILTPENVPNRGRQIQARLSYHF